MRTLGYLVRRNTKLFFKDKGVFFTSLIAPLIILLLFITFLGNVYRDSFHSCIPEGLIVSESLIEGFGRRMAHVVPACGLLRDGRVFREYDHGAGQSNGCCGRFFHHAGETFRNEPWILPFHGDRHGNYLLYRDGRGLFVSRLCRLVSFRHGRLLVLLDVFLLVLFGTALSSVVCHFLNSQGGMTAVSTIVSSAYGFLCGAYMPISQFSVGIQKVISFLPGTYGTALLHNHFMRGVLSELETNYFPAEVVDGIRDSFDNNLYFFGDRVDVSVMYLILGISTAALVGIYVILNVVRGKKRR